MDGDLTADEIKYRHLFVCDVSLPLGICLLLLLLLLLLFVVFV